MNDRPVPKKPYDLIQFSMTIEDWRLMPHLIGWSGPTKSRFLPFSSG